MNEPLPSGMQLCTGCEFFQRDEAGRISFACDPFSNVKEPACLLKWQLIKINQMVEAYQTTLQYYQKLAPMQDRLFKAMERELGDMDEGEKWKQPEDDDEDPQR
jgi:hypothetical protein